MAWNSYRSTHPGIRPRADAGRFRGGLINSPSDGHLDVELQCVEDLFCLVRVSMEILCPLFEVLHVRGGEGALTDSVTTTTLLSLYCTCTNQCWMPTLDLLENQLRKFILQNKKSSWLAHQLKAVLCRGPLVYVREPMSEEHLWLVDQLSNHACVAYD